MRPSDVVDGAKPSIDGERARRALGDEDARGGKHQIERHVRPIRHGGVVGAETSAVGGNVAHDGRRDRSGITEELHGCDDGGNAREESGDEIGAEQHLDVRQRQGERPDDRRREQPKARNAGRKLRRMANLEDAGNEQQSAQKDADHEDRSFHRRFVAPRRCQPLVSRDACGSIGCAAVVEWRYDVESAGGPAGSRAFCS